MAIRTQPVAFTPLGKWGAGGVGFRSRPRVVHQSPGAHSRQERREDNDTVPVQQPGQPNCVPGTKEACAEYVNCDSLLRKKYREFPYTDVQMMQAYGPERLLLVPGTFQSVHNSGLLKRGSYDVATLQSVTGHLPNVHDVAAGIFQCLGPGKLLCISHHNYCAHQPP